MRRFYLARDEDVTGVSGTGVVATGLQFADGQTVIQWCGEHSSLVVWRNVEDAMRIHGHDGATRLVWLDRAYT